MNKAKGYLQLIEGCIKVKDMKIFKDLWYAQVLKSKRHKDAAANAIDTMNMVLHKDKVAKK